MEPVRTPFFLLLESGDKMPESFLTTTWGYAKIEIIRTRTKMCLITDKHNI